MADAHDTVAEAALVEQLESGAQVAGERWLASTDDDRADDLARPAGRGMAERPSRFQRRFSAPMKRHRMKWRVTE